jgi:hypothetical protein
MVVMDTGVPFVAMVVMREQEERMFMGDRRPAATEGWEIQQAGEDDENYGKARG